MKRIVIEGPSGGLEKIFSRKRGYEATVVNPDADLPDADLIVFSGGADIDPSLYGQTPIENTYAYPSRDVFSLRLHKHYKSIPKVGVCRGAQFLCAVNGGSLWQHIPGHLMGKHNIYDIVSGNTIYVLGDHHQACYIPESFTCIAKGPSFPWAFTDKGKHNGPIISHEAFYIHQDKALCVQFHPEWGDAATEEYFWELMERYMI